MTDTERMIRLCRQKIRHIEEWLACEDDKRERAYLTHWKNDIAFELYRMKELGQMPDSSWWVYGIFQQRRKGFLVNLYGEI